MPENENEQAPANAEKKKTGRKRTLKRKTKLRKGAAATQRVVVSAEQLPRKNLEQALRVARALRDVLAGGPAKWDAIARAMGIAAGNNMNKYYLWSAAAYNLVEKDGDNFSLSEIGRKILAPTRPNEDKEAIVRAILTPVTFSRFFTDYNGNPFPADDFIGNVLEERYLVPRVRVEEATALLRENGYFAGILRQEADGSMIVRLDPATTGVPRPPESPSAEPATTEKSQAGASTDFAHMCFVVTPIGDDDSNERRHANMILKSVIEPVTAELGLVARRADQIDRAGLITKQTFECLAKARICIADLSFNNPNAFYELGVRHMCKLPTVQIIRKGDRIPFDVSQGRTIKIDMADVYAVLDSVESAKKELRQHLKHALSNDYKGEDNPVNTYLPGVQIKID
ncbi:MAG: hypothetical protein PHP88_00680 [bacterium]|nr:hypothetical protein [bacterium]